MMAFALSRDAISPSIDFWTVLDMSSFLIPPSSALRKKLT
jgi:hypothetical protein